MSLFVAGTVLGEGRVSLFATGAVLEGQVSLFVTRAVLGEGSTWCSTGVVLCSTE